MKKIFPVGKAAALSGLTAEALRHYDRTGLCSPHGRDEFTGYRLYTEDDVITLRTIALLRRMDISLPDIDALLKTKGLEQVIARLKQAESQAARKIAEIEESAKKIENARAVYEKLTAAQPPAREGVYELDLPERTIFVSSVPDEPHAGNLWDYRSYFYREIAEADRDKFSFGDTAAVLFEKDSRLFIDCAAFAEGYNQVRVLPAGQYFCLQCPPERVKTAERELAAACAAAGAPFPAWHLARLRIVGLLKWEYILQAYTGRN